jgi:hypothetical protein
VANGVSHEDIARVCERQAEAVILRGDETLREQDSLIGQLKPIVLTGTNASAGNEYWQLWSQHCKPLITRLISNIDNMRTPEWQRGPDRHPSVLPDTYEMKLWLLPWSSSMPSDMEHSQRLELFAAALSKEIDSLAVSQSAYFSHWSTLKAVALSVPTQDIRFLIARFGSLDSMKSLEEPGIADYMRIEVADALLQKPQSPEACPDILKSWRQCENEDIRMRAIRTMRIRSGNKMLFFS